tara:strand:+ start:169 stop:492 length:324 start_codon:yes stop_codon:yes gene_type:complete
MSDTTDQRKITIRKVSYIPNSDPLTNIALSSAKDKNKLDEEVSFTAKINNLDEWKSLPIIKHITEILIGENIYLVTGRTKYKYINEIRSNDIVKSFKVSRKLHLMQK